MVSGTRSHEDLRQAIALAQERLAEATAQRAAKAPDYDNDPLFAYLWNRAWGTSEYDGSGIVRLLDGWVARVCRFNDARAAYWMLNEMPIRLQQRIGRLEAQLQQTSR